MVVVKWFSVLDFNSDDPSSNPTEAYNYFWKFVFEKNENKQKRGQGWYIFKKNTSYPHNNRL